MRRFAAVLAIAAALCGTSAHAASCSIAAQPVSFGSYDPLALLPLDAVGQVTVTCSNAISILLSYTVSLSTGTSGRYDYREMAAGANRLRYNLYTDVTRLLVWGDGSAGTTRIANTFLITLLGVSVNHPVYGRVAAQQNAAVGSYADVITATVEF